MKLRDTKLGHWLKDKAPKVLDVVGDLLPDKGVLGIVKNLVSNSSDVPDADKLEFARNEQIFEVEIITLEVDDRKSARTRETEFVKATGHIDYLMWFLVITSQVIFGFMVWSVVTGSIPEDNRELIFHIFGLVEGAMLTNIFNYYFGSSAGSRIKDMKK